MLSDLAPFVAAVLKDGTMADLKSDYDELRLLLEERLLVQITGPNGTPVHYEGSLKNSSSAPSGTLWNFFLDKHLVLPLNKLVDLEIRLGGNVVHRFDINAMTSDRFIPTPASDNFDLSNTGRMFFESRHSPVLFMYAKISGPRLYADLMHLPRVMNLEQVVALHQNDQVRDLIITGFTFKKSEISGSISLLEKLGISPIYVDEDDDIAMFNGKEEEDDENDDSDDCLFYQLNE
jgi:hypothetical protein